MKIGYPRGVICLSFVPSEYLFLCSRKKIGFNKKISRKLPIVFVYYQPISCTTPVEHGWAGGTFLSGKNTRCAWAGGTFFPVVPLCQFFGCGGKWFLVLLLYLEYNTWWHVGIGILRGRMTDRWLHVYTLIFILSLKIYFFLSSRQMEKLIRGGLGNYVPPGKTPLAHMQRVFPQHTCCVWAGGVFFRCLRKVPPAHQCSASVVQELGW